MRLVGRCPFVYNITVFILNLEGCSWDFVVASDVLLANGYLSHIVLHGNFGYLSGFVYGKLHIFRICISIRSMLFMERIFLACNQLAVDFVRLVGRCPFVYNITVFILNLEGCSRDFVIASDVLLADGYLSRIIFHENRTIDIFAVYGYLACCIHNKFNGFCNRVTIWSGFFCQGICASIQLNGLWCAVGYPFCNGLAVCIGNLQACTFEFFRAIDCTLADDNITQRCIIHGYLTIYIFAIYQNLAGLVNGKGNGFCNLIAIRSGDFHQFVSAASNQCTFYHVCFCARCPSIHFQCNFALIVLGYIVQFQLCTSQFIRTSHCLFADGYLCDIILHDDNIVFILVCCIYCDCAVLFNRKGDIFGIRITIRSVLFVERIGLTCNQLSADVMRLVGGCPFFDDIIVFILNLEGCSRYFVLTSNISLVNGYLCDIILHDDHAVFILVCCVYCNCAVLFNRKGEIFSIRITIRSILFVERIGLTSNQLSADVMRLVGGCPFFNDLTSFILYLEGCFRYFVLTGNISLVNGYLCDIIFHDDHAVFVLVCCIYCDRAVLFNRKGDIFGICIAIRSVLFVERIGLTCNQLSADVMRLVGGCPFFDDIIVFILNLEGCSRYFVLTSNISLVNGYLCDIILHDDHAVFILVCCVYCNCAVLFNRKGEIFSIRITIRSILFVERIGLTSNQLSADVMRLVGGCPFFNDLTSFILYLEGCFRYFVLTGNISLVNGYLCDIIFHDDHAVFVLVCCIYCDRAVLFNRKGDIFGICIAIRSSSFFQRVSSAW